MIFTPPPLETYAELTEKVRSGEYYREARSMYDLRIHDLMAERYLYILITGLSTLIFTVSFFAMQSLYPLEVSIPFIYSPNDIVEDQPRMKSLLDHKGENPSEAVLRFLVQNYVQSHEEYDIATMTQRFNSVKSQSSPGVIKEYEQAMDPRNPESPVAQYQRHSRRHVSIIGTRPVSEDGTEVEVLYDAIVESKNEVKKSRWKANITFRYSGIELDEKDKPKPLSFVVTQYRTKRLQESQ